MHLAFVLRACASAVCARPACVRSSTGGWRSALTRSTSCPGRHPPWMTQQPRRRPLLHRRRSNWHRRRRRVRPRLHRCRPACCAWPPARWRSGARRCGAADRVAPAATPTQPPGPLRPRTPLHSARGSGRGESSVGASVCRHQGGCVAQQLQVHLINRMTHHEHAVC